VEIFGSSFRCFKIIENHIYEFQNNMEENPNVANVVIGKYHLNTLCFELHKNLKSIIMIMHTLNLQVLVV
jgi:hypothetical protein